MKTRPTAMGDRSTPEIIANNPIGERLDEFCRLFKSTCSDLGISESPDAVEQVIIAASDKRADRLVKKLLAGLQFLDAAAELPPHPGSSRKSLSEDIAILYVEFPRQTDMKAVRILIERVIDHPDNEESIWSAVYGLFSPMTPPPRSKSISPSSLSAPFLHDLHSDWNGTFFKDPLIGLRQQMKDCINGSLPPYYAKTLVFVQSSGVGKSRLADTFGTTCPMINFILRIDSVGYPPTDGQIQAFMREPMPSDLLNKILNSPSRKGGSESAKHARAAIIWNHSVMFGILKASFKIFNVWVEGQTCTEMSLEELAHIRHGEMKPLDTDEIVQTRSQKRIDFCDAVVQEAYTIATQLAEDQEWRNLFNSEGESAVRRAMGRSKHIKELLSVVERLTNNLKKFRRTNQSDGNLLIIVFDEAASLFSPIGSPKLDSGRYIALNRMCSLLKDHPLWFFFLSTESKVEKILPADNPIPADEDEDLNYSNKSSARFAPDDDERLRVFPAFVAFPLDIEDRSRMRDPALRKIELAKPMAEFSRPEHIAMFGRRLWYAYSDPQRMYSVARLKLVGGGAKTNYDPRNQNHVFAALSFRLSLDPCLENSLSLPLVRTAVGSFMRVVISINQATGSLHTVTPSEPILAKAAMEHLCDGNWPNSIGTLTRGLLQQGLIEKGLKGELFARLVLILAHDSIRRHAAIPGCLGRVDLERMPTFAVEKFLMALYAEDHHQSILKIDSRILQAKMNFTHFTSTRANLPTGGAITDLCHDLLRRSAAMQLSPNNPTFDQLIPIYFGSDGEPFNPSECGVILIQDKNRVNATTPNHIFREQFAQPPTRQSPRKLDKKTSIHQSTEYTFDDDLPSTHQTVTESSKKLSIRQSTEYAFREMSHPILFLLFDMGINPSTAARVQVSRSTDDSLPSVWAIHSRGHTDKIFGCLKAMGVSDVTEVFFASAVVGEKGMHGDIARRNLVFDELERGFRYARMKTDESGYVEELENDGEQDDNDIQMEDV